MNRRLLHDGERGDDGLVLWFHEIKAGDRLRDRRPRLHVYKAGDAGVLLHVRAVVDGYPVVRWWSKRYGGSWSYELIDNPYYFGDLIVRDGTPPVGTVST